MSKQQLFTLKNSPYNNSTNLQSAIIFNISAVNHPKNLKSGSKTSRQTTIFYKENRKKQTKYNPKTVNHTQKKLTHRP